MANNNNNLICFGDVIKLSTKSAFADAAESSFVGFLEHKSSLLLVVPPTKDEVKDKFVEAEFVVSAIRGDKPPAHGTPLSYKQPFVLKTSDGSGYSLNNKTDAMSGAVSLQVSGIKGEMYVAIEKQGFAGETHVQDGDLNVELVVVDSNRIRKTQNNTLTHFTKAKTDATGGYVSCSGKGQVLTFKVVKVADKTETRKYIKDPQFRRASQMLLDPVKADETSEASVLETPSRAGSIVASAPLIVEEPTTTPVVEVPKAVEPETVKTEEQPQEVSTPVVDTTSVAVAAAAAVSTSTTSTDSVPTPAAASTPQPSHSGVSAVELAAQLHHVVQTETVSAVTASSTPVASQPSADAFSGLSTIELSVVDPDAFDGSAPVHFKIPTSSPRASTVTATVPAASTSTSTKAVTTTKTTKTTVAAATKSETIVTASEVDTLHTIEHDEHVDTSCVGKCSIM